MTVQILIGDCRDRLKELPDESVHCVVTSPPYWGLRDYGVPPSIWGGEDDCDHEWGEEIAVNATNHTDKARWNHTRNGRDEEQPVEKRVSWLRTTVKQGQFCQRCGAWAGAHGLEPHYELYVENEVRIFREVRRVLRADGTLWLNLGDSYATGAGKVGGAPGGGEQDARWAGYRGGHGKVNSGKASYRVPDEGLGPMTQPNRMPQAGLKPKDLCGIPWRVAFALQADGWWLRQDIIWSKPNPMPESVTDRCTKAHEYLFMLAKSERYYYDRAAASEAAKSNPRKTKMPDGWDTGPGGHGSFHRNGREKGKSTDKQSGHGRRAAGFNGRWNAAEIANKIGRTRNRRSVWTIATQGFKEAHFATFPPKIVEPCIRAGCPTGGTVLDPFAGAGTTGLVADRLGRNAILIELNPDYAAMARRRIHADAPLLHQEAPATPI